MASITIKTAQNVSIDYQLATWIERILAFFIDFIVIIAARVCMFFTFEGIFNAVTSFLLTVITFSLYTLLSEMLMKGQTLGKKALRLRVIKLDGEAIQLSSYMLRWSFRLVEVWASYGTMAAILCGTSRKGQRLGDVLANTIVVKEKTANEIRLNEILKLKDKTKSELKYPNVTVFTEEEMLFTKNTLARIKKHPNEAHKKAFLLLFKNVSEKLGVKNIPSGKREAFLKEVINDYIIATR